MHRRPSGGKILVARLLRAIVGNAKAGVTGWCPTGPIRDGYKWKPDRLAKAIREAVSLGWVESSGDRVRLSRHTAGSFKLVYDEGPAS